MNTLCDCGYSITGALPVEGDPRGWVCTCPRCGKVHASSSQEAHRKVLEKMLSVILTQDNLGTAHPVFVVQTEERDYGINHEYSYDGYIWYDIKQGERVCDRELEGELEVADAACRSRTESGNRLADFEKRYYRTRWNDIQWFFTDEGAKQYIKNEGHNLRNPRVYVKSFYRNPEMIAMRALLFVLAGNPSYRE